MRVLVEKPLSKVGSDVEPSGQFENLANEARQLGCCLKTAEHYMFRPGVTQCMSEGSLQDPPLPDHWSLNHFLESHKDCTLKYEFRFCEKATRDDPNDRPGPYQDGAILDILAPHSMGPVVGLILPALGGTPNELDKCQDLRVRVWSATDQSGNLKVATLTETAARITGTLRFTKANNSKGSLSIDLCSVKGHRDNDRFFRVSCPVQTCKSPRGAHLLTAQQRIQLLRTIPQTAGGPGNAFFYGVSLGPSGFTVVDLLNKPRDLLYTERDSGHRSDRYGENAEAAVAHAAMLNAMLDDGFERDKRFVEVADACALIRLGLYARSISEPGPG